MSLLPVPIQVVQPELRVIRVRIPTMGTHPERIIYIIMSNGNFSTMDGENFDPNNVPLSLPAEGETKREVQTFSPDEQELIARMANKAQVEMYPLIRKIQSGERPVVDVPALRDAAINSVNDKVVDYINKDVRGEINVGQLIAACEQSYMGIVDRTLDEYKESIYRLDDLKTGCTRSLRQSVECFDPAADR